MKRLSIICALMIVIQAVSMELPPSSSDKVTINTANGPIAIARDSFKSIMRNSEALNKIVEFEKLNLDTISSFNMAKLPKYQIALLVKALPYLTNSAALRKFLSTQSTAEIEQLIAVVDFLGIDKLDEALIQEALKRITERAKTDPLAVKSFVLPQTVQERIAAALIKQEAIQSSLSGGRISSQQVQADFDTIAFSASGKSVVLINKGSALGKVRFQTIQDPKNGVDIKIGNRIISYALSTDGLWFAVGTINKKLELWSLKKPTGLTAEKSLSFNPTGLCFSHDNKKIAVGGNIDDEKGYEIILFEIATAKTETISVSLKTNGSVLSTLAFSDDDKYLSIANAVGEIIQVNLKTGEKIEKMLLAKKEIGNVRLSNNGQFATIIDTKKDQNSITIYDMEADKSYKAPFFISGEVSQIVFDPLNKFVVALSQEGGFRRISGSISLNDLTTGKLVTSLPLKDRVQVGAIDAKGETLVLASIDLPDSKVVYFYDLKPLFLLQDLALKITLPQAAFLAFIAQHKGEQVNITKSKEAIDVFLSFDPGIQELIKKVVSLIGL
ncbi:WD40 repeat domain-containing protein [Candidatus Dependentiae bacterium]|nr:WD40 repeat domain-containing protein [Candidatus Dependentiae bacterium]